MKFTLYNNWAELPKSSDALFLASEKESIFFSREWFEAITPHLVTENQTLKLLCVINDDFGDGSDDIDDSVLAILPLLTNDNKEWTSFTHPYSALFSILLVEDKQSEILKCLCNGLKTLDFDYLTLAPIAKDDNKLINFKNAMVAAGLNCYCNHKAHNWFHQTNSQSFEDYMNERPSKVRNTIQRKQRKLAREYDYEIQLYIDNDIEHALAIYHDIYKVSWKANEQHKTLVKDVVNQFAKQSWPRLALLFIDNKPIAAQLWFVVKGKASIFRLVYDQKWKEYSPGTILMSYLLEHVIDKEQVTEIDFLSGNDRYKQDWMSERRERVALVCVNKEKKQKHKKENLMIKVIRLFKQ